jgi:diguanylate cyclase (GGDEF)-like protein/PAS domain S-box-containing protein
MTVVRKRAASASPLGSLQDAGNLRELVARLQEGIYVTNAAGDFLDANPALLEVLGVPSLEELRRHKVTDFIDSELRAWKVKRMERDGFVRDLELQIRRLDGSTRTVLDTAFMQSEALSGEIFCCGILVDITERKQLEVQLKEQAVRDPLTGCLNRRYLSMLEITGEGMPGSWGCLVIDVDHFKEYNDRYGHHTGDQVLVKLAHFLMRQVRAEEAVIRTGGDEFLIVMTHADATHTEAAARRLEAAARQEYMVPFSLGWAARQRNERLEKTIARADKKLYTVRTAARGPERERRRG